MSEWVMQIGEWTMTGWKASAIYFSFLASIFIMGYVSGGIFANRNRRRKQ